MTLTLPQSVNRLESDKDGLIRLPDVALPPAPSFGRRARFVSLVLLGYAYVLGMLAFFALVFLSLLAAGAILGLFVVGAVFVVVLPALRVRFPRPEGEAERAERAALARSRRAPAAGAACVETQRSAARRGADRLCL